MHSGVEHLQTAESAIPCPHLLFIIAGAFSCTLTVGVFLELPPTPISTILY